MENTPSLIKGIREKFQFFTYETYVRFPFEIPIYYDTKVKLRCDICNIEVNGKAVLEVHLAGAKHFKKMKLIESLAKSREQAEVCKPTPPNPVLCFKCEICNVSVNSIQQLQVHSQGIKHKNNVANLSQKQNKPVEKKALCCLPAHPGVAVSKFSRKPCNTVVNSAYQLEQRGASRKLTGKITRNVSKNNNKNRFESHSSTDFTQPDNPPESRICVQQMNSNASYTNHNNRFKPYSKEKTFRRETPVIGSTGAADVQFSCSVCKIKLNSAIQLQQHEASKKHAEKVSGYARPSDNVEQIKIPNAKNSSTSEESGQTYFFADLRGKAYSKDVKSNAGVKRFKCETCNVSTNSMVQLQQHYQSLKHLDKVEGNPEFKGRPAANTPQAYPTKNFFKRPLAKRKNMSDDSAGPHKFNNSAVSLYKEVSTVQYSRDLYCVKRPDFVSPQQPVLDRMLNNFKSNSDDFNRF